MVTFLQYVTPGIALGIIYGLTALGFVLVYKASGVLNIAQGAFLMLGAYLVYTFSDMIGLPIWAGILLALATGVVLALIIERLLLRPLLGKPVFSIIMVTVAMMAVIVALPTPVWGTLPQPLALPWGNVLLGPVTMSYPLAYGAPICLALFVLFWLFYRRTKLGLGMRATADDESAAHSVGISSSRIYGMSWIIAIMAATVAGIFCGWLMSLSEFLGHVGLKALPIAIIGGLDSIGGALLAGVLVGLAEYLFTGYLDPVVGFTTREVAPYILMLILLIIKPYGLFGLVRIERI